MSRESFVPRTNSALRPFINNFADRLLGTNPNYAVKYGITPAEVTLLDHGRQWVNWCLDNIYANRVASVQFTQFKDLLFFGKGNPEAIINVPAPAAFSDVPAAGTPPVAITPIADVVGLAASLGKRIKSHQNYDTTDGAAMGLEGSEHLLPNAQEAAPDLSKSHITTGGRVEIVWKKGRFDGIRIEVDRGDSQGWRFLAVDTQPDYVDTVKPAPGTSAKYRYRAIYLLDDEEFGQWSQPFEITVAG